MREILTARNCAVPHFYTPRVTARGFLHRPGVITVVQTLPVPDAHDATVRAPVDVSHRVADAREGSRRYLAC
jgi:hypothetical protein